MKTISKSISPTFAAFVLIPLRLALVVLAIAASTANGAPGDEADNGTAPLATFRRVALSVSDGEDRGNGNSAAEGIETLNLNTTGANNTAHGWYSLSANTEGSYNTANGFKALWTNTTGSYNTADGYEALYYNTTGRYNTANGTFALSLNTAGDYNTANGFEALGNNTTGFSNTATGSQALLNNTTGGANTADGTGALHDNSTGNGNTANGFHALLSSTTGSDNTATGSNALLDNTTGYGNAAIGHDALLSNTTGNGNTATGWRALYQNTTGSENTAVGFGALFSNTTGNSNVALGSEAGEFATTGSNNVYIGAGMTGQPGDSNVCFIASIFGQTAVSGAAVLIQPNGKLGTLTSSRRFKEDIKPMDNASDALLALKPVTFRYKKEIDPQGIPQFGLVAEEVEKVNPRLVVRDKEGKVNTVRYEAVNAMLLNEFLKEHRTVEELKKEIAALSATIKKQAGQIQKVSAQLGRQPSAPRVVAND